MTQSKSKPVTDEEWTIHALNIHGTFFERWCAEIINKTDGYRLEAQNYPVEFPRPNNGVRGKESALDIRAATIDYNRLLTLIIECKKNNPEFVDWIFFPVQSRFRCVEVPIIINETLISSPIGWEVKTNRTQTYFDKIPFTDDAREAKGNYQSISKESTKTKTSNASISEAAYQVSLATQAILQEEIDRSQRLTNAAGETTKTWEKQILLPVIVTTARLFVCEFNPADIDASTGEIPFEKAELIEHPQIIFNYPLPRHLQYIPSGSEPIGKYFELEKFMQLQIMVVHSTNFPNFLQSMKYDESPFF